jgi:hypothetical protein
VLQTNLLAGSLSPYCCPHIQILSIYIYAPKKLADFDINIIYPKSEQRIQSNQEVAKAIINKLKDDSSGTRSRPQGTIIYGTDPGADIDNKALLCIASLLHKCNVSNVLLIITNRENKTQRARSAKRIIKDMGASQIQIASSIDTGTDTRLYHTYGGNSSESDEVIPLGEPAVVDYLERLRKEKKRCKIVVVSSFSDLLKLLEKHADLIRETVSAFFFQGG